MRLYTCYDKLAQESGPLFEAKNDTVAVRMFNGINFPGNRDDYQLLFLGVYSHDPVNILPNSQPVEVISGTGAVEDE